MLKGCLCNSMAETFHGIWNLHSYRKEIAFSRFIFWFCSSLLHLIFVPGGFYAVAAPTFTIFLSLLHLITFRFLLQIKLPPPQQQQQQQNQFLPPWLSWKKWGIDLSSGIINF